MSYRLKFVQVDAFTRTPFLGNPAAVCLPPDPLSDEQMQTIALELNLSETAFLYQQEDHYALRWFTPTTEVDLCGHATLASAHVLFTEGYLGHSETAKFETRSGRLIAKKRADHISMDFPSFPLEACGELPEVVKTWQGVEWAGVGKDALVVEFAKESQVRDFRPNFEQIMSLPQSLVIITAPSDHQLRDFVCRVFVPKCGIPEDPVTGSAFCTLGPHWMKKLHLDNVQGEQVSHRRGIVHVEKTDDPQRLTISGQAVTTLKGIFTKMP